MTKRPIATYVSRSSSTLPQLGTVLKLYVLLAAGGAVLATVSQFSFGLSEGNSLAFAAVITVPAAAWLFKPWRLLQKW